MENTPIQFLDTEQENALYIKRDDLIPYSFGGNKARKACLFFEEIDKGAYDCVVTYGSSHSNHCRIVSNMAAARGKKCYLIGPEEVSDTTFNSKLMQCFGAEIITVPVENVHETIEEQLHKLKKSGKKPYFIPGGGHGNLGTQAYVNCYNEIKEYEKANHIFFEYIFFASGTGTTQAGLICGQIENADNDRKIIGISIARRNPRGRNVVVDSVEEYMGNCNKEKVENNTIFIDNYIGHGYGKENEELWINNSSSFITGSAGNNAIANADVGTTTDYTSTQGVKASTTGTVYGVYDMSGGAHEYVAAYVDNGNSNLTKYGSSLVNGESKTKNMYSKGSTDNRENNYSTNSGKYGDAVYETSANGNSNNSSWYNDYSPFPYTSDPFFGRGGDYSIGMITGAFCFGSSSGEKVGHYSFRPVLVAI